MTEQDTARASLLLLDLTRLDDEDDEVVIDALCRRASQPWGHAAAVCVWPRFVERCRTLLAGTGVRVATVANFPHGGDDIAAAVEEVRGAIARGAQEVDLVMPYHAWLAGERGAAREMVAAARDACADATLKVILETGRLRERAHIVAASRDAIAAGADFIKTSTGKIEVSATPEAAAAMLHAIREANRPVGFKAAGGIRTLAQARVYLDLAEDMMGPDWIAPQTFRFGASALLDAIVACLAGTRRAPAR